MTEPIGSRIKQYIKKEWKPAGVQLWQNAE
jgi:hypothetical protein